jgi:hypothetical protein
MRETIVSATASEASGSNVFAGQALRVEVPIIHRPADPFVLTPANGNKILLPVDMSDSEAIIAYGSTLDAGFYQIGWNRADGQSETTDFAVSIDPRESDPQRMTPEQLDSIFDGIKWRLVSAGAWDGDIRDRSELWRTGATALLGLIFCESLLAAWIGRER